jgi:AraC-like DNA-binding protein
MQRMDPLSDVFNTLEVRMAIFGQIEYGAPWGLRWPAGHNMFGMILRGQCWLNVGNDEVSLAGGDCFLMPGRTGYVMRDDPSTRAIDAEKVFEDVDQQRRYGGKGRTMTMISGCFMFDAAFSKPMLDMLPSLIHVKAEETKAATLQTTIRQIAAEIQDDSAGSRIVVNRLVDIFFLQAIRFFAAQQAECNSSWLRAVADPQIGRVLAALHRDVSHRWTVQELADTGGMSRAAFALRFKQLLGETPLEYLTRWRMYKATRMLRDPSRKLLQIANDLGYESDGAFNRAFKRMHGVSAGEFRQAAPI